MYGERAESSAPSRELPVGIHPQVSDLAKRIGAAICQAEKMLDRVRGSQPQTPSETANKNAAEPSTQQLIGNCHSAMGRLESCLNELQTAIA